MLHISTNSIPQADLRPSIGWIMKLHEIHCPTDPTSEWQRRVQMARVAIRVSNVTIVETASSGYLVGSFECQAKET